MIALDYQPFSVVEDRGFRELMETLKPHYKIPSRKHFSRYVVLKLYSDIQTHMKQASNHDLETVKSMPLTIDLWTSQKQESYITVTNHYLTRDFEMKNHTLECSHFPSQHTGSDIYQSCGINLPLTQIPIYVVSDNAKNMSSAQTGKPVEHLSFAAHNLQLAVSDAVAEVGLDSLLKTCRSIVGHYKHSTKSKERLQSLQKKTEFTTAFSNSDGGHMEWNFIASYVTILEPLFLATKKLCRKNVPTLLMVRPILYSIEGFLKNYIRSRTGEQGSGIRLARALLKSLTARFHYIRDSGTHLLATILDSNGDPLEWWKSWRNYPCLVELAMHYLSIPATPAASERVFLKAGLTIFT
ncbi:hypothetical protein PR048_001607 [Dryococelus australis]|uniref:HAT C-terminal dimerisation domain-containing protein n=1 Tax=Dryococelus australis TaxID=614101 RepID=A0ABQ9IHU7_9NEOP|nr:hypothetical protein PR048_001607 [Dryococelus australis]